MQAPKPGAGWNKFKIHNRDTVEYLPGHPRYKKRGPGTNASISEDLAVKMARARKARIAAAPPRLPGGPDRPPKRPKLPPMGGGNVPRDRHPMPPRPPRPPRRPPNPPFVDSR